MQKVKPINPIRTMQFPFSTKIVLVGPDFEKREEAIAECDRMNAILNGAASADELSDTDVSNVYEQGWDAAKTEIARLREMRDRVLLHCKPGGCSLDDLEALNAIEIIVKESLAQEVENG